MTCVKEKLMQYFDKFNDDKLTYLLNFKRNEINVAYINSISCFRLKIQRIIYISAIIVLLSSYLNTTSINLMKMLPLNLTLIIFCLLLLIFSKKYLWLYYIFTLIFLLFCGYIYIECILIEK